MKARDRKRQMEAKNYMSLFKKDVNSTECGRVPSVADVAYRYDDLVYLVSIIYTVQVQHRNHFYIMAGLDSRNESSYVLCFTTKALILERP